MGNRSIRVAVAAAALVAAGGSGWACGGDQVLLEDRFATFEASWGEPGDGQFVEAGRLVLKPAPNTIHWMINDATFADLDVCVTVTTVEAVDAERSFQGLIFWYVDDTNFHAVEIDANGHASAWRQGEDGWRSSVPWRETDLVVKGDGGSNRLRVVAKGGTVSLYINGALFDEFTGTPPPEHRIGVVAASPDDTPATFAFSDLEVTAPL